MGNKSQVKGKLQRILIINRGEIACRLIQACGELGRTTVAVYSEVDKNSRHVQLAHEAFSLGDGDSKETYLNIKKLVAIGMEAKCNGVHPGYGFLSEQSQAAQAFTQAGIVWIGPQSKSMQALGDKILAKEVQEKAQVPILPWEKVESTTDLHGAGERIGYPLLVKASAGGGGKGMRLVEKKENLLKAVESASREAGSAFGDSTLFLEKYISRARHIEVQILGDHGGEIIHLGERDCSSQRRHQKVIEEAPASHLSEKTRLAICQTAVRIGKAAEYSNAGTVEFLMDDKENFYFLEMNVRLQVEHSVTEAILGVDIVHAQIRLAEKTPLAEIFPDQDWKPRGHSIEVRIYGEDPSKGFIPCSGNVLKMVWPMGVGIRVDTALSPENHTITLDYDPMIAKLTVWAVDRERAIEKMLWSLKHTILFGVTTNINYLQDILQTPEFRSGTMHVEFLDSYSWVDEIPQSLEEKAKALFHSSKSRSINNGGQITNQIASPWDAP